MKGGDRMKTVEQLAKKIMAEYEKDGEPISFEDALEVAEMELKSKENFKNYVSSEPKKPENKQKKPKTVKISAEKAELFDLLWEGLSNYYENSEILKPNKLISVNIGEKNFKIDIIETRQKKSE